MRVSPISFKRAIKTNVPKAVVLEAIKEAKEDFPNKPQLKKFMNDIFEKKELDIYEVVEVDKKETYIFTNEHAWIASKHCFEQYAPKYHIIRQARGIYETYGDNSAELNFQYKSSKDDGIEIQKAKYTNTQNNGVEALTKTLTYSKN